MNDYSNTPRPSWQVTSQTEMTRPNAQNQFVSGVQVNFTASNGLAGSVFVPHSQYTADNVKAAILEKLDKMNAVQNLSG